MSEFWNLIVESNTFNFVILVAIFWVLAIKLNLPEMVEKIRYNVAASIENAKLELKEAQGNLKSAKNDLKKASEDADEKVRLAQENAEGLSKDILNNAKVQVNKIAANVMRVVESEEKKISAQLTSETMLNAVYLARKNIIEKLKSDKDLQNKLVSDSIKELEEMTL